MSFDEAAPLVPAPSWSGSWRAVRRAVRHRPGLQLPDARRLRRRRAARDARELPAPASTRSISRSCCAPSSWPRPPPRSACSSPSPPRCSSRAPRKRRNLYLQLVMLPFWTSFLVRTYAWIFLLRDTGLINTALQALGIIHEPAARCSTTTAPCCSAWSTATCPFMVLPIYATLERLDPSLVGSRRRPRRAPAHDRLPRHRAARQARHRRRLDARLHPLPRRVPHARPARRRTHRPGRQPGAEPVHHRARLALRLGRLDRR